MYRMSARFTARLYSMCRYRCHQYCSAEWTKLTKQTLTLTPTLCDQKSVFTMTDTNSRDVYCVGLYAARCGTVLSQWQYPSWVDGMRCWCPCLLKPNWKPKPTETKIVVFSGKPNSNQTDINIWGVMWGESLQVPLFIFGEWRHTVVFVFGHLFLDENVYAFSSKKWNTKLMKQTRTQIEPTLTSEVWCGV